MVAFLIALYEPVQWERMVEACMAPESGARMTILIALSCLIGYGVGYCTIWLQSLVSSTSFMVLGCLCKSAVIFWGILFEANDAHPQAVIGALLSILGSLLYSIQATPQWMARLLNLRAFGKLISLDEGSRPHAPVAAAQHAQSHDLRIKRSWYVQLLRITASLLIVLGSALIAGVGMGNLLKALTTSLSGVQVFGTSWTQTNSTVQA